MKIIQKYILATALIIGVSLPILAQKITKLDSVFFHFKEGKAHKNFRNYSYINAIEMYEDLLSKGYFTDSLLRCLAISYYKIGDTKNAEDIFRQLIDKNLFVPSDIYFYVQTLKYNKKYDEADLWMDKYAALNATDSRTELQKGSSAFIKKLIEMERYKIELASFNSENADFGAVDFDGNILFASSRNDQSIIRFEDAWKKAPYFALYYVKNEDASVIGAHFFARKFNTVFNDGPVCFNADESEIFVTRNSYRYRFPKKGKAGVNNLKILSAKKTALGTWSSLVELPFNNNEYSCGHPTLTADGKTLFFASDMPGGLGGTDIYSVSRTDSGWSTPQNLGKSINTEGDEMFPFIHSNGYLYFASNGRQGMGGLDLYISRKSGNNNYVVKNMGYPVNSSADDFGLFLRNDSKTGFFASNRSGGKGDDDIYSILVTNPINFGLTLNGTINDSLTGEKLNKTNVQLLSEKGEVLQPFETNTTNEFSFPLDEIQNYSIRTTHEGYASKTIPVNAQLFAGGVEAVNVPVVLYKVPEWGIYGNVYIKGTKVIVPAVNVKVFKNTNQQFTETTTADVEEFRTKLEPETDYQILFSKKGFLTKRAYYSTKNRKASYVNINEFVDVDVIKLEIGAIVEIPNIYYDLAKWNIRPDAAIELEKVVQFLNDNPSIIVELGSHTDSRGSDASNQTLSQKRAQSAVEFIVKKGIDVKRITAKGYGESKLKNKCANGVNCTEEEHQQNRRTEIQIIGF